MHVISDPLDARREGNEDSIDSIVENGGRLFSGSSEGRANEEYENREKSKAHLITLRMPFMGDTRGREAANFVFAVFAASDLFTPAIAGLRGAFSTVS